MELRHLRYFIAVAEELSFRRAAEKLNLAQPPLSAQIKALEEMLGTQLFLRSTRKVSLTSAGRVLLDEARAVIAASQQAERRVREARVGLVGTLRLGVLAPAANSRLAGVLRNFRAKYPGVQLALHELTSIEQIRRLREGQLDVGLVRPPVPASELATEFVENWRQVLALPSDHPLARKRKLQWKDFDKQAMVMMHPSVQHLYYDSFLAACATAGATPYPAQYAHDVQTKLWLISAGFGLAPASESLSEIRRPGLVYRDLPTELPSMPTVIAWRKNDDSQVIQCFRSSFRSAEQPDTASAPALP